MFGEELLLCDRFSVSELTKETKFELTIICLFIHLFVETNWCVVYSGFELAV